LHPNIFIRAANIFCFNPNIFIRAANSFCLWPKCFYSPAECFIRNTNIFYPAMSSFISAPYIVFRGAEFFIPDQAFVLFTARAFLRLLAPFPHAPTDAGIPMNYLLRERRCAVEIGPPLRSCSRMTHRKSLPSQAPDEKNPAAIEAGWWRAGGCAPR